MNTHEYSQGICADGAAILKDGVPMTPEEIVRELQANQQGFLDGSDHIPDATKMIQGSVQAMGNLCFNEEDNYTNAVVIEFASREDFRAALESGQCRFTVFGG